MSGDKAAATKTAPGTSTGHTSGAVGQHASAAEIEQVVSTTSAMRARMETVVDGKSEVINLALTVLLAEGHLLIEDVPGVGKTLLAKTMAIVMGCNSRRIQFTPDLLPSDITGVSIFRQENHTFEFMPGPVFSNVVLGDEINRAGPKTQSALLEAMEEHQVTVDGTTYPLDAPFMVIATQNPVEMDGTFPLPEAQRDRFMVRVSMGYPSARAELDMLDSHGDRDLLRTLNAVTNPAGVRSMIAVARRIYASPLIKEYIIALMAATRNSPEISLGASPRSSLAMLRAARAHAAMSNRGHVLPEDVQALAVPVLAHRLIMSPESIARRRTAEDVLRELLARVPIPRPNA